MKQYYSYNPISFHFVGSGNCQISPKDGEHLIPNNATSIPIPSEIPKNMIPKFDKLNKKWDLVEDPKYRDYLERKIIDEELKNKKELEDKLSEVDGFGATIYKKINNNAVLKNGEELLQSRKVVTLQNSYTKYHDCLDKFLLLSALCYIEQNENNRIVIKNYKDQIELTWKSIDGTIPWNEIKWPEPPEL